MQFHTQEFFARHLNETFTVSLGNSSVDMTLVEVRPGRARKEINGIRSNPFALYFRCTSAGPPQGMYTFGNAGTGDIDIFVVPLGREPEGMIYEAVFN
jgi:hypothetical protein